MYERDIGEESLSFWRIMRTRPASTDDGRIGWLPLFAGLAALGQYAGRATRVSAARSTALAAAHRVADRVHRGAAVVRLATHPTLASSFAEADVHVLGVAYRPDGRPAGGTDAAYLTRRQRDLRPSAFARAEGCAGTGASANLSTVAGLHLQVMHRHAQRDSPQGDTVAEPRLHF